MKTAIKIFWISISLIAFLFILNIFFSLTRAEKNIKWGIVFSQKHAEALGLDWKEGYLAMLDDLKANNIKILVHWDLIENKRGDFFFEDLDWKVREAEKRDGNIILVIGMKPGRWPECHIPGWARLYLLNAQFKDFEESLLNYIKTIVERYKNSKAIVAWQVENEPFFYFGDCPKIDKELVKREISLVKSLDSRPIIFADSGEFSFWIQAAKMGDIVSTTLHRKVYFKEIKKYITYPIPPMSYYLKSKIVKLFFGKDVIIGELQAEPWCKSLIYNCDLEEQNITMNFTQFKENVKFAKKTRIDTIYFWGVEWWYWMKEKQNDSQIWEESKRIFQGEV